MLLANGQLQSAGQIDDPGATHKAPPFSRRRSVNVDEVADAKSCALRRSGCADGRGPPSRLACSIRT